MKPVCTLYPLCIVCVNNMFTHSSCVIVTLRKRNVFVAEWVSNISSLIICLAFSLVLSCPQKEQNELWFLSSTLTVLMIWCSDDT